MSEPIAAQGQARHEKLMFWGCFIALITTAFAFISRMFLIKTWGAEFGLDEAQEGALLGIGVWPFAVSIVLFSLFIDKIGYKVAMVFSFVAYLIWSIIGVAAYFVSDGGQGDTKLAYQMLYWGSFLLALSNGTVEAYINPVVATMFNKNKTKWLNILHAGWPGGLAVAGIITIIISSFGTDADPVPWWIRIGIIAVPAVVFFLMLMPLKFPVNERVASGVTYRQMLAEFGFAGAAIVSFLLTLQFIEAIPAVPAWLFIALGVAAVVGFGAYTQSLGNPFVFFMALIMMPLATTEIGTDGWITGIMEGVFEDLHPGWVLVYTSVIMMTLRFFAGPIVHTLSPIGLLIISAVLAIAGLATLSFTAGVMIFAAATLYAFGKTFFWPTMLGIVSEQSPRGGALTLNALGGIGMLAVGVLGFPFIGALQANKAVSAVESNALITQAVPAILADEELTVTEQRSAYYGLVPYEAIDDAKVTAALAPLPEPERTEIADEIKSTRGKSAQGALANMTIFPGIMLVAYIGMFFYFKGKGGYQAQHLTTEDGLTPHAEEDAATAPR